MNDDATMGSDGEEDMALRKIQADLQGSSPDLASPSDARQVDLFSEIHLNELKKLEKQLESVENEKVCSNCIPLSVDVHMYMHVNK